MSTRSAPCASIASAASTASAGSTGPRLAERIGGDVEDAHHERPPAQFEHPAARERNIEMTGDAHSCGSGLFSAGTIGARSFWRGLASSSSTGDAAARGAAGCGSSSGSPATMRLT